MATAALQRHITAGDAVTQVMRAVGLVPPPTIYDSLNKTAIQMWQLATDVGQQLSSDPFPWEDLQKTWTITTVIGQPTYDLPSDFNGFSSDTSWNRTTRLPALGSLSKTEWAMLKARLLTGTTYTAMYRVVDGVLEFYNNPSSVQTITIDYQSAAWALGGVANDVPQDNLQLDSDIIKFDKQLFKSALKLRWLESKGFNTQRAEREFYKNVSMAKANDVPGRTLSLSNRGGYPYLGNINVPDTGYGS